MAERIDDIGFGNIKLLQDPEEFCYGVDAVLLAHFAANNKVPKKSANVLAMDLGTGTGIIPMILAAKTGWSKIIGVEVREKSFHLAEKNVEINNLEDRIKFVHGDVKDHRLLLGDYTGKVDVITCNPPYTKHLGGLKCNNDGKSIARHESTASLSDFMRCAKNLLRPGGHLFMVHRPARLVDLCYYGRKEGLEPKEMCFVSPKKGDKANILLVHFVSGGGEELKLLEPLNVYESNGKYTRELLACYDK